MEVRAGILEVKATPWGGWGAGRPGPGGAVCLDPSGNREPTLRGEPGNDSSDPHRPTPWHPPAGHPCTHLSSPPRLPSAGTNSRPHPCPVLGRPRRVCRRETLAKKREETLHSVTRPHSRGHPLPAPTWQVRRQLCTLGVKLSELKHHSGSGVHLSLGSTFPGNCQPRPSQG